jgi:hypothetical protein
VPDAFPETLGGWRRTAVRDAPVAQPPDAIPAARIEQIRIATYEGPGKLEARVYALPSASVALDVAQRWRPAAQTVFFESGRFFIVVQWEKADRAALQAFVTALEKRFEQKRAQAKAPAPPSYSFYGRIVNVFAIESVPDVSPFGVTTLTRRGPVFAPAAIVTVAVSCVPPPVT